MSQNEINQVNEKGEKHGLWVFYGKDQPNRGYSNDAVIKKGYFVNSRLSGLAFLYYPNEKIKLIGNYINGRPSGLFCRFDSTENVIIKGQQVEDEFSGEVVSYFKSGCIKYTLKIDKNKSDSIIYFYDDCEADSTNGTIKIIRETDQARSSRKITGTVTKCVFYNNHERIILEEPQCDHKYNSICIENKNIDTLENLINKAIYQILSDYNYYTGMSRLYDECNQLLFNGQINNKVIHEGKWYEYDESGQLKIIFTFKNGKIDNTECF